MSGSQHNPARPATYELGALESPVIRTIIPARRRLRVRDLPLALPVVRVLSARDFKIKYKQSALGPLWLLFQPFALLAGFLIAFRGRGAIGHGIPYLDFALSGLAVWSFFQIALMTGALSLIANLPLIRFTPCPRLAFPLAATVACLPSLIVPTSAAVVSSAATGTLSPRVAALPLAFVWLFLLIVGIVALTCSVAVRFRDVISVLPFLVSLGLFVAPVGYPLSGLPHALRGVVDVNPLTGVLEAFRWVMLKGYHPSVLAIGLSLVTTTLAVVIGWRVFARLETTMADEI